MIAIAVICPNKYRWEEFVSELNPERKYSDKVVLGDTVFCRVSTVDNLIGHNFRGYIYLNGVFDTDFWEFLEESISNS